MFLCFQREKSHLSVTSPPFMDNSMKPMPPVSVLSKLYGEFAVYLDRRLAWFMAFIMFCGSDKKRFVSEEPAGWFDSYLQHSNLFGQTKLIPFDWFDYRQQVSPFSVVNEYNWANFPLVLPCGWHSGFGNISRATEWCSTQPLLIVFSISDLVIVGWPWRWRSAPSLSNQPSDPASVLCPLLLTLFLRVWMFVLLARHHFGCLIQVFTWL